MSEFAFRVLRVLADGKFHSGEAIARELGCSRTLIWQTIHDIQTVFSLPVFSVRGQGYRLATPIDWLDVARIRQGLAADCAEIWTIAVADDVDSTNSQLLQRINTSGLHGLVLACERQTAGRGRHGKRWQARLGDCLMFSVLWRFERGLAQLAGLSLAVGQAMATVLRSLGVPATLKWPNDLLLNGKKLAGILIELSGEALGPASVVIGVGINLRTPSGINQAVTSIEDAGIRIDRNILLARLLNALHQALLCFDQYGFAAFSRDWMALSAHQDQPVRLHVPHGAPVDGVACGVADNGALLVKTFSGVEIFHVGEVSLRSL